jgi:hypothetical protein
VQNIILARNMDDDDDDYGDDDIDDDDNGVDDDDVEANKEKEQEEDDDDDDVGVKKTHRVISHLLSCGSSHVQNLGQVDERDLGSHEQHSNG